MAGAVAVRGGGAAIDLGSLSDVQLATVARWLTGLGEAAGAGASAAFAGFGLAMIPVNTGSGKWINLPGPGHVRLFYSHDEPGISLRYVTADGAAHELDLGPWPGGKYRDPTSGKVIARWVKVAGKGTLILAVGSLLNRKSKNGDLCPMPKKENHGTLGRAYEDYVKAYFNPGNPTPSGFGYQVPKIRNLNPVNLDDCQQSDPHNWAEYKGPGYEKHLIKNDPTWWGQEMGMIIQAEDEREAEMIAGRKNIYWFFDEPEVAAYMAPILQIINPDIHTIAFPMRPAR